MTSENHPNRSNQSAPKIPGATGEVEPIAGLEPVDPRDVAADPFAGESFRFRDNRQECTRKHQSSRSTWLGNRCFTRSR